MTRLVAHNAPHEEVLHRLQRSGLLDHISSCGVHREGWWGSTRPTLQARLEEHAEIGLATEMPVRPLFHPELPGPKRDFRYGKGEWSDAGEWKDEGHLQVILFDGGKQWYADIDLHAPIDVVGAIGHALDVLEGDR